MEKNPFTNQPMPSKSMRKTLLSLRSGYPDAFDWSLYDRLHDRFAGKKIRGSTVFKTPIKLVNHHYSCTQCHYAVEVDSYGRGCTHNCAYCYAKERLEFRKFWNNPIPFPADLSLLRKMFSEVFETDRKSKWRPILEKRIPLRIGCMSDSFMKMDKKYGVTLELLKILGYYSYPYIIATRSDLVADEDYISVMSTKLAAIQFSIIGINEKITKQLEPGAPSVAKRLNAAHELRKAGFWVAVRLNPLFPTYPDGYFTDQKEIIERFGSLESCPRLSAFDIERVSDFVGRVKEANVPTIIAGFVRLSPNAIKRIGEITEVPFRTFFRLETYKTSGNKRYSDSEIGYYYKKIKETCDNHSIRFTNCYIGNGEKDFYQYQNLWSNRIDCCDAVGNVNSFLASSQQITWNTRKRMATCKKSADLALNQSKATSQTYETICSRYDKHFSRSFGENRAEQI